MEELWYVLKLALVLGLVAGIAIWVLNYIDLIPAIIRKVGTAVIVILALFFFADRVIPMLGVA